MRAWDAPAWAQSTLYDTKVVDAVNRIAWRFVLSSLAYLTAGVTLGGLSYLGILSIPIFVHAHLNLVGFLLMLVFGMAYKLIPPMFARRTALYSLRLARLQFWLMNAGLVGMTALFGAASPGLSVLGRLAAAGTLLGCYLFIFNMAMTLLRVPPTPPPAQAKAEA